jgi:L-threonylcarbamoyladenylate synthase
VNKTERRAIRLISLASQCIGNVDDSKAEAAVYHGFLELAVTVIKNAAAAVDRAAQALRDGKLVAFPTETVYGLGADASNGAAVARIFSAKGRPRFNPLIVHVTGLDEALRYGTMGEDAIRLAEAFWPGPLTLVVPRRPGCGLSELVSAGLDTVALRAPAHEIAQALIRAADLSVAAPSANRSGGVSPTRPEHVAEDLDGRVELILDAGPCAAGIESTVVALFGGEPLLLRPGAASRERVESVLGVRLRSPAEGGVLHSPGGLSSHYAPRALLRLEAEPRLGEPYLAFGPGAPQGGEEAGRALNLSPSGNLEEAAANLFAYLRALDALGTPSIAAAPIPQHGLGEAINDRLRRAAADRSK